MDHKSVAGPDGVGKNYFYKMNYLITLSNIFLKIRIISYIPL